TARIGVTEKEDRERRVDQQDVFHRMALFLAAITAPLFNLVLGAYDVPFGPIVAKRGETGAGAGATVGGGAVVGGSGVGTTTAAASAAATPRRLANSCTDRVGASPR